MAAAVLFAARDEGLIPTRSRYIFRYNEILSEADMHGHRGHGCGHGRHARGEWGGRHFGGGRHGMRGGWRGGRVFDHGDLRLLILPLVAEKPRHGYELIKAIEERLGGPPHPRPRRAHPPPPPPRDPAPPPPAPPPGGHTPTPL